MEQFAVEVKSKNSLRAKLLIGNFDLAIWLPEGIQLKQSFLSFAVARILAPEIRKNHPHDLSLDIWTLG